MKEKINKRYDSILKKAEEFHGHLGPFLVIGIKMGLVGLGQVGATKGSSLAVTASLPLRVPFSCIIDGLQITTKCTIGNQKLTLRESEKIQAEFKRKDNGQKTVVALNQSTFEKLKSQLLQETLPDEKVRKLAWKVATIPETELFLIT